MILVERHKHEWLYFDNTGSKAPGLDARCLAAAIYVDISFSCNTGAVHARMIEILTTGLTGRLPSLNSP